MSATRCAPEGAVAAAAHLAATAGAAMLEHGGNAVDAAIAAAAVMAVTSPHMCGLGGDLFALVVSPHGDVAALDASGRAGSGADPERLRASGADRMPFEGEVASVTVPGCVDGLVALHERFATLDMGQLLGPARRLAAAGFPVSPTLAAASQTLERDLLRVAFGSSRPLARGRRLAVPGVERALAAVAASGRAGFYEGEVGRELLSTGAGLFDEADLRRRSAEWVAPLTLSALGRELVTVPPCSQGYLALAGAWIAEQAALPRDPDEGAWAFTLVEAARQAAFDRPSVLHEHADGPALLARERLAPRAAAVAGRAAAGLGEVYRDGGTTYLAAVDGERRAASLIMSNGANFGSRVILPGHGIFLHNRGIGFSLQQGHPAEYGPSRRPPHTLSPLAVLDGGRLDMVLGTMGGDAQPQILLQLLARTLAAGQDPGEAVAAPRWVLAREGGTGFDTWEPGELPTVLLEEGVPAAWGPELRRRGHRVSAAPAADHSFGHAQMIRVGPEGILWGAADPRTGDGSVVGR